MQWYWLAVILGVILPWLMFGKRSVIADFREVGVVHGLCVWFAMCWFYVPMMLLIMWIIHDVIG